MHHCHPESWEWPSLHSIGPLSVHTLDISIFLNSGLQQVMFSLLFGDREDPESPLSKELL